MRSNPKSSERKVKNNLLRALNDFESGVHCACGNDLWVIGSSFSGNGCFSCITGETDSSQDFEIDKALPKRNHIQREIINTSGYFDDNGNELNPDLYPTPHLCLSCKKNDNSNEEVLCNLTRLDQVGAREFKCFAYENKY